MSFRFGFSPRVGGGRTDFDPSQLSLTGWWRANYAGSPWTGVASAGSSGSRDLTEATNPPTVSSGGLSTFDVGDWDGTNDLLGGANTSNFYSAATGFAAVLFNADTAAAPGAKPYNSPGFVSDAGGPTVHFGWATTGIWPTVYNGTVWVEPTAIACATGAWHWAFMWWASATLYVALDRGSSNSVAIPGAGTVSLGTNALRVGRSPVGPKWYDGKIAEILLSNTDLSGQISNIVSYGNTRYALSL